MQGFTHPLWFLLWVALGSVTNQWVVGILLLGVALTGAAFAILAWHARTLAAVVMATGLLALSNAFMEFATSGLENPLGYLTVGVLLALTLRREQSVQVALLLGLVAAAVVLTRFDLVLMIAVPAALCVARWRHRPALIAIAAGSFAIPVLAWLLWSKATYDTFLPNTFEAKRNVHIPTVELVVQGLRYLWVSLEHDPVTAVALLLGVLAAAALGSTVVRAWALGVVLYVAYVVWIGGDFFAGRFLAIPVYVAVFLLVLVPPLSGRERSAGDPPSVSATTALTSVGLLLLAAFLAGSVPVSLSATEQPRWEAEQNTNANVADTRGMSTASGMSLRSLLNRLSLAYVNPDIAPLGDGSGLARELREVSKAAQNWPVSDGAFTLPSEVGEFCGYLGNLGIATGPAVHLIDTCALTDRYLAGRPFVPAEPFAWHPGHFHRSVPEGYADAVRFDDPGRMTDPADEFLLRQLWERIR